MPCIDYLPSGTNTNSQRVILNDGLDGFGTYREVSKVDNEELENDTTESSQNSYPDVLDDWYSELEALTEAANDKEIKENMARLATECASLYPIEECDTEDGTLFQLSVFITGQ